MIEAHPIQKDYIPDGARVLVVAVSLDGDFLPEGSGRGRRESVASG